MVTLTPTENAQFFHVMLPTSALSSRNTAKPSCHTKSGVEFGGLTYHNPHVHVQVSLVRAHGRKIVSQDAAVHLDKAARVKTDVLM